MTTFKQFLAELADRNTDFEITSSRDTHFDAEAIVGDRKILFSAGEIENKIWGVSFSELKDTTGDGDYEADYGATGSGNEFEVLSLVTSIMKEFLKRNDPDEIRFSAAKEGKSNVRAKIYRRLADRLLKGYKREEDDDGPEVGFRYTKS